MPKLFIHVTNQKFQSRDDGGEYDHAAAALALGVRGAVGIAAEEVVDGEPSAAVEISVETEDGTKVLRSIVVVSVSPLNGASPTKPNIL